MKRAHLSLLVAWLLPNAACSVPDATGQGAGPGDVGDGAVAQALTAVRCRDNGSGRNGFNPAKQLFWGELHLHTAYSLDAYSFATRTTPRQAYLFAKGGTAEVDIGSGTDGPHGPTITQPRPLDFTAITDHSEFLDVISGCVVRTDSGYYNDPACEHVRDEDPEIQEQIFPNMAAILLNLCGLAADRDECVAQQRSAWLDLRAAAQSANDPCHFTAFIAYEWSAQPLVDPTPDGPPGPLSERVVATNHRNVIFASSDVPDRPLSSIRYPTPPLLWRALDHQCTGNCAAVTLPHNSNLSAGVSLQVWDRSANGLRQQEQYQVSAEIYQHKGASECYFNPALGYAENECLFEQLDPRKGPPLPTGATSFLRSGLERGLAEHLRSPSGLNPLKLGIVAATDGHNGAPGNVDEATWNGHSGRLDDFPEARLEDRWDWGPGGITGVWAEENTRHSIFRAIQRRETYGTSGPRIPVRIFQTDDVAACSNPNYLAAILPRAKPMGSTFHRSHLRGAARPTFVIEAWPDGTDQTLASGVRDTARLAKVQVIKIRAWMAGGQPVVTTEPPRDLTADEGFHADGGCMTWTDTSFNPSEAALYYVRVLQEPTLRWTQHDCAALFLADPVAWNDVGCNPTPTPHSETGLPPPVIPLHPVHERAWTSPIWYEPR